MSKKKLVGAKMDPDGDLHADFERYMERKGLETKSDGVRMAIKETVQPDFVERKIAQTLLQMVGWMGIITGLFYTIVLLSPSALVAQLANVFGLVTIALAFLYPPVMYPVAKYEKRRHDTGYLTQITRWIATILGSKPKVSAE